MEEKRAPEPIPGRRADIARAFSAPQIAADDVVAAAQAWRAALVNVDRPDTECVRLLVELVNALTALDRANHEARASVGECFCWRRRRQSGRRYDRPTRRHRGEP